MKLKFDNRFKNLKIIDKDILKVNSDVVLFYIK